MVVYFIKKKFCGQDFAHSYDGLLQNLSCMSFKESSSSNFVEPSTDADWGYWSAPSRDKIFSFSHADITLDDITVDISQFLTSFKQDALSLMLNSDVCLDSLHRIHRFSI